jgi:hypothetical protein
MGSPASSSSKASADQADDVRGELALRVKAAGLAGDAEARPAQRFGGEHVFGAGLALHPGEALGLGEALEELEAIDVELLGELERGELEVGQL